jgi:hypothetical protein
LKRKIGELENHLHSVEEENTLLRNFNEIFRNENEKLANENELLKNEISKYKQFRVPDIQHNRKKRSKRSVSPVERDAGDAVKARVSY